MTMPNEGTGQGPEQAYPPDRGAHTHPMGSPAPDAGYPPQGYPQQPPQQQGAYQGGPPGQPVQPTRPTQSRGMSGAAIVRQLRTPETKEFFKTSEFALTIFGVLILWLAAAVQDNFDAPQMWNLFTIILLAYIISRGIAKAASNKSEPDRR